MSTASEGATSDPEHIAVEADRPAGRGTKLGLGGLHHNIQLILPETRDPKVYDAIFRSLREHLI
jgi:hypothetical protein